jgi:hypothetical protein
MILYVEQTRFLKSQPDLILSRYGPKIKTGTRRKTIIK